MASKKMIYLGGISVLVVALVVVGLGILQKRSFRNQTHVSAEPAPPADEDSSTDKDANTEKDSDKAKAASTPVPGSSIKVTMIDIKAIQTNDGGLTGEGDEVYVQVYRGVGINQRHFEKFELGSINPGDTRTLNKVLYDGPRVQAPGIEYIALDYFDGDDGPFNQDDHLGGPVFIHYRNNAIVFGPGDGRVCSSPTPASVTCKYEINGDDDKYVMRFRADLH